MKSLQNTIRNLPFDAAAMEYDSQLRRLLLKNLYWNDLAVEELWLPGGRSRADIAVVNEQLFGFEIKAGRDRLDRLPRQILAYDSLFRFSSIVTVPAHLSQVEKMLPSHWGVWVALGEGRTLRLRCLRKPSANWRRDTVRMARLLNRAECIRRLRELGLGKGTSRLSKEALAQALGNELALREMDEYLCKCLHERAVARAEAFTTDGVWNAAHHEPEQDAVERDDVGAGLSLSHLAHAGVLDTRVEDRPLSAASAPSRSPAPVSPQIGCAGSRLDELRAEFARVAREHLDRAAAPRSTSPASARLGFGSSPSGPAS